MKISLLAEPVGEALASIRANFASMRKTAANKCLAQSNKSRTKGNARRLDRASYGFIILAAAVAGRMYLPALKAIED